MNLEVRNKIKEFAKDNFYSCIAKIGYIGTFFVDDILDTIIFEYNIEDKDYTVLENILWDAYNECKESIDSHKSYVNEEILVETKEDIDNFTNKFGKEAYDFITKYKQRFVNNKISTDLSFHTKNTSKEEMNKIISDLFNKVVKDEKGDAKLNYKYLGEEKGFKVYEILDWETAMNMGGDTGWCIAGRYDTDEVKPSQAKQYFNQYTREGYRFFYFIGENTKYCLQLNYNNRLEKLKTNFIVWNADDNTVKDISEILSLPINLVKEAKIEKLLEFEIEDGILIKYNGSDKEVTIPEGVTIIGSGAFEDYSSLTKVTIPNGVTSIDEWAFAGCHNLTNISIPNSVTSIGRFTFFNCTSLANIVIPDSVTSISDNAFERCNKLISIVIPDSVTRIGAHAFYGCHSLTSITIPNSITSIGERVFYSCDSLTSITIPKGVISIGDGAFYNCVRLSRIIIPSSVTSIGDFAFSGCTSLKDIYYSGTKDQFNKIDNLRYSYIPYYNPTIHYNSKLKESLNEQNIPLEEVKMRDMIYSIYIDKSYDSSSLEYVANANDVEYRETEDEIFLKGKKEDLLYVLDFADYELEDEDELVLEESIEKKPEEDLDKTEATLTDEISGVSTLLNNLIKDEFDAIDEYNSAITTLQSEGLGEDILSILYDIIAEENVHVGQLQKALESINPIANKNIQDGEEEGTEQIEQSEDEIKLEEDSNKNKVSNKAASDNKLKYNKDAMKGWVTMDEWGYDPADDIYEKDYEDQINYYRKLKGVIK